MKNTLPQCFALFLAFVGLAFLFPGRAGAQGFQLPLTDAGSWGQAPATLAADIQRALKDSGFLDAVGVAGTLANDVAHGKVPASTTSRTRSRAT